MRGLKSSIKKKMSWNRVCKRMLSQTRRNLRRRFKICSTRNRVRLRELIVTSISSRHRWNKLNNRIKFWLSRKISFNNKSSNLMRWISKWQVKILTAFNLENSTRKFNNNHNNLMIKTHSTKKWMSRTVRMHRIAQIVFIIKPIVAKNCFRKILRLRASRTVRAHILITVSKSCRSVIRIPHKGLWPAE